jgi:uncharacterized membrane protein YoaK (UPF0700 family)
VAGHTEALHQYRCAVARPDAGSVWKKLVADPKQGPLPALMLALTIVTGLVDAVSILALGRVFVANMTGNVVFVGFALAGAPGFSLSASLFALAGFLVGAFIGGMLVSRYGSNRAVLLFRSIAGELALIVAAAAISQAASEPYADGVRNVTVLLLAAAMGIQNAMARKLAVPDLTTTVLTMTITGLAAEVRAGNRASLLRRGLAVATMAGGAILGAVLVIHVRPSATIEVAAGIMLVVAVSAARVSSRPAAWQSA